MALGYPTSKTFYILLLLSNKLKDLCNICIGFGRKAVKTAGSRIWNKLSYIHIHTHVLLLHTKIYTFMIINAWNQVSEILFIILFKLHPAHTRMFDSEHEIATKE